ncbi:MAG: hypothetical protein RIQ71_699 [Verrucomicrobiota bacterium]
MRISLNKPGTLVSATALVFLSGTAALILQVCWFREFRLIFGMTTASASAVLAVFMGGLGLGNLLLGRRADRVQQPLLFYALLEAGVAVCAALTPFALDVARNVFISTGGQGALGRPLATLVRLGLTAAVLAVPTFLMGGTLPTAARAFTSSGDNTRRMTAWLYGANTLGAVTGASLATFFLLESFGVRWSLWIACLGGAFVSIGAFVVSRQALVGAAGSAARTHSTEIQRPAEPADPTGSEFVPAPPFIVYAAAATAGFVFFAMELVWYRMLTPILGGTTFTFGLILAVALAGMGCGAAAYALFFARRTPTLFGLALTFLFGGLGMVAPFAAGDRLAVLVAFLKDHNTFAFAGEIGIWASVAGMVVFPFSFVSGVQFPLFIALCGEGRHQLGRQVGVVFFANTVGSIAGALAGGFGLLPLLGATGAWRALALLMVAGGVVMFLIARRTSSGALAGLRPAILVGVPAIAALVFLLAEGPTAAWRHGGVGAGRAEGLQQYDPNSVREWRNRVRGSFVWEVDGTESSVGLSDNSSFAFYINGKCDGNAVTDAGMQIMLGLLGAALHPEPRSALVVGLGSGETAGWLAQVSSVDRVDVVELEPAILEVARRCASVNHEVLDNPKVNVLLHDAREFLLAGKGSYDLIACEPSNPYRSGVADLFTAEFYRAARARLAPGGIFLQWLQGYEVDEQTFRTVLATLRSVFPHVEIWQTKGNDLVLLCSEKAPELTASELRTRLASEPFASALPAAWLTAGAEGFLAHYMGGTSAVDAYVGAGNPVPRNTDDRNHVEYGFARTLGRTGLFDVRNLLATSLRIGDTQPRIVPAGVDVIDWESVARARLWDFADAGVIGDASVSPNARNIIARHRAGDLEGTIAAWEASEQASANLAELLAVTGAYAGKGDEKASPLIERLRPYSPAAADVLSARLALANKDVPRAADYLKQCFMILRASPWLPVELNELAFRMAVEIGTNSPEHAPGIVEALSQPFAAEAEKSGRLKAACFILAASAPAQAALPFLKAYEPHVPWAREFLTWRRSVYEASDDPLAAKAAADVEEFERNAASGAR